MKTFKTLLIGILALLLSSTPSLALGEGVVTSGNDTLEEISEQGVFWQRNEDAHIYKDRSVIYGTDEYSYRITCTKPNHVRISETFELTPNTMYIVSAYVKTDSIVDAEGVTPFGASISTGDYQNSGSLEGTNDWTRLQIIKKSDGEGKIEATLNLGYYGHTCTGTVWFSKPVVRNLETGEIRDNNWNFLCIIPRTTNIQNYCPEPGAVPVNATNSFSDGEIQAITEMYQNFGTHLSELSDGMIKPHVDVLVSDVPVSRITRYGEKGYHFSNDDAKAYVDENHINLKDYDHVIITNCIGDLPNDGYLGLGGSSLWGDVGYSYIEFDDHDYMNWYCQEPYSYNVYTHEFLHWAERRGSQFGTEVPSLHDATNYGYVDEKFWDDWYNDFINAKVKSCDIGVRGVPEMVWRLPPHLFNSGGTMQYNGHSYQLFDQNMTWDEARLKCESLGGHLVTITDSGEQSFVENLISSSSPVFRGYWIGGHCDDGVWNWITGEGFDYTNFDPGEPNGGGTADVMQIYSPSADSGKFGKWDDTYNNTTGYAGISEHGFVCEWN